MATEQRLQPLTLEDRRIIFRNFSGKATPYNAEGKRNFCLVLDEDEAQAMKADGWNVKWPKPKPDRDDLPPFLQVNINFSSRNPPRVVLITSRGRTTLEEDMLVAVDWAEITALDLIINPYHYEVGEKTGISAYLRSIYITIREDELELKYADIPDTPGSAAGAMAVDDYQAPEEE